MIGAYNFITFRDSKSDIYKFEKIFRILLELYEYVFANRLNNKKSD